MKSIAIPGGELHYLDRGEGSPYLFAHGFPFDHSMWMGQIEGLASRYRVIAPDLRGFGLSQSFQNPCTTMEQFADDLAALLDALQISEPVLFCGLSMGGYIAFQFYQRHRARLRGLALCDTRATADSPEVAAARQNTAERVLREGPGFLAEDMPPKLFSEKTKQSHPEWIQSIRATILATSPQGIAAAARGMAVRSDMTGLLPKIDSPTLVMVGQDDILSPPDVMRDMARSIPKSTFVDISAAGHVSPLENPVEANAALSAFMAAISGK